MKTKYFRKIYFLICFLYSQIFNALENIFYYDKDSINIKPSSLVTDGYKIFNIHKADQLIKGSFQNFTTNKYMHKIILGGDVIKNVIDKVFVKGGLKNYLTSNTGFNYSIDYLIAYKTFPLPQRDKNQAWYANHWHYDSPFSPNTLKIIIPIKPITSNDHGGMEIINKHNSYKLKKEKNNISFRSNDYQMIANCSQALIFYPNICLHRAGEIKDDNYVRQQIMFQLNPSKKWRINGKLFQRQKVIEPKFPFFSYFFDNHLSLKNR